MTVQWIVNILLISLVLYNQIIKPTQVKHERFVEGYFCSELANNLRFKNCHKLLVAHIVEKLKTTFPGPFYTPHSFSSLFQQLVLFSGDVQLHSGPVKFPCVICSIPIASNHHALECNRFDFWCHIKCVGISLTQYNKLIGSVTSWICPRCGTMQFSGSFFSTS